MTPTARTLAHLRRLGADAVVVERWNHWARRRVDLFGGIDIIAVHDGVMLLIQATSGSNHAARAAKVSRIIAGGSSRHLSWLLARGAVLEVWSWSRRRASRRWRLRRSRLSSCGAWHEMRDV